MEHKELALEEHEQTTLYGYDIKELVAVAILLNENNVSVEQLKSYGEGYKKGYEHAQKAIREAWEDMLKAFNNQFKENE